MRRHPDIKLHAQPDELAAHADKQLKLLRTLWATLRPGGSLLYCTCSLLQQENDDVIARFIEGQGSAQGQAPKADDPNHEQGLVQNQVKGKVQVAQLDLPSGRATKYGWQLTPLDPTTDGFYYARLTRGLS